MDEMSTNRIVISSGHSKYVRGASGILDEVDEARAVVEEVASLLMRRGVDAVPFHDDTSKTQNENLNTIVNYHNAQERDLDVSVHFNAYVETDTPMGVEVLYVTQAALAGQVAEAIADAGDLIDRGAKKRTDLFFLNHTDKPAILIEVCFVDSECDAGLYEQHFDAICESIADVIGAMVETSAS
jgi:N-acetylmuramoyl-L-alanine amidase